MHLFLQLNNKSLTTISALASIWCKKEKFEGEGNRVKVTATNCQSMTAIKRKRLPFTANSKNWGWGGEPVLKRWVWTKLCCIHIIHGEAEARVSCRVLGCTLGRGGFCGTFWREPPCTSQSEKVEIIAQICCK